MEQIIRVRVSGIFTKSSTSNINSKIQQKPSFGAAFFVRWFVGFLAKEVAGFCARMGEMGAKGGKNGGK